jgi:hypothetical protein
VITIDGKASRRTRSKGRAVLYLVSALAARQRLVLAQAKIADKSNEIVATPKLPDLLHVEGASATSPARSSTRKLTTFSP